MADQDGDRASLPDEFRQSVVPADRRETVTLTHDADALQWLRATSTDWQAQLNELLCFFHDTSVTREAAFDPDGFEPGEMIADVPPSRRWSDGPAPSRKAQ